MMCAQKLSGVPEWLHPPKITQNQVHVFVNAHLLVSSIFTGIFPIDWPATHTAAEFSKDKEERRPI